MPRAATPSLNLYEVEVIVFSNQLPDMEGGELWRFEQIRPENGDIAEAVVLGEQPPAESLLSPAALALEQSGRHHVLAHLRWQQNAEVKSSSKPVKISNPAESLDGALRLYSSRYLLMDINLTLREPARTGFFGVSGGDTQIYRLSEFRRIKLLETHYFDHPKFGVLVRVAPVKEN
jgi:hypothetical protein